MILYRIYTEDIHPDNIAFACVPLKYYTLIPAKGVWQGIAEGSLVIEVIDELSILPVVRKVARTIKQLNNQEVVLVTQSTIESELV